MKEVVDYLEDEWFVVRHSGEMPEVAYHSSIFFLTSDEQGPKLALSEPERMVLKEAAAERYREIVLRDLQPENKGTAAYRGVMRSIHNFQRFRQFCTREKFDMGRFPEDVSRSLQLILECELRENEKGTKSSALNCTFDELSGFADEVGLGRAMLSTGVAAMCSGGC